ncbi:LysR family transcriptional regulator [Glutamicibacter protophormiae]
MHLSTQNLHIFLTVVEAGSISAAARTLFMSQPSVSANVRNLESALSAPLLERRPSGVIPTAAGQIVVEQAQRIMEIMGQVDEQVARVQGLADQKLSVAGTSTLGSYLLPRVLQRFMDTRQGVRTELRVGNAEKVAEWIVNREVSIAICAGEVDHEQLEAKVIFDEALVLAAHRAHPLAGQRLTPQDLAGERFLQREIGSATRLDQDAVLAGWGLPEIEQWTVYSAEAARESVRSGLGVALISEHVVGRDLRSGEIVRLLVDPAPPRRPVTLVHRGRQNLTSIEHEFVELLTSIKAWPAD